MTTEKPPIKSGWRGHINGFVESTDSQIQVTEITLKLDRVTAWALANQLSDRALAASDALEGNQVKVLSDLGAAIGRLLDHHSAK